MDRIGGLAVYLGEQSWFHSEKCHLAGASKIVYKMNETGTMVETSLEIVKVQCKIFKILPVRSTLLLFSVCCTYHVFVIDFQGRTVLFENLLTISTDQK